MRGIGILRSSLPKGLGTGLYGALAFSCTATGEERYFCCPLDRCGLAPASHTVSPRSGKDPSPPQVRPASSLRPGRSNITSGVRPSLYPGPMPQGILMYTTGLYIRNLIPDDTSNPSSASPGRSEWGYAELRHNGVLGSSPAGRNKPGCVTDLVQPYLSPVFHQRSRGCKLELCLRPGYEDYLQFGVPAFLPFMQNSTSFVMSSALK